MRAALEIKTKRREDVILVDGKNLLCQNADRLRDLTYDGNPTDGIFGFLKAILALRKEWGGRVVVCWEGRGTNFRKSLYPEYKGHRGEPAEEHREFLSGLSWLKGKLSTILKWAGVTQYTGRECEVDDILATLARRLEAKDRDVLIFTGDADLRQLAGAKIRVPGSTVERRWSTTWRR